MIEVNNFSTIFFDLETLIRESSDVASIRIWRGMFFGVMDVLTEELQTTEDEEHRVALVETAKAHKDNLERILLHKRKKEGLNL